MTSLVSAPPRMQAAPRGTSLALLPRALMGTCVWGSPPSQGPPQSHGLSLVPGMSSSHGTLTQIEWLTTIWPSPATSCKQKRGPGLSAGSRGQQLVGKVVLGGPVDTALWPEHRGLPSTPCDPTAPQAASGACDSPCSRRVTGAQDVAAVAGDHVVQGCQAWRSGPGPSHPASFCSLQSIPGRRRSWRGPNPAIQRLPACTSHAAPSSTHRDHMPTAAEME